MPTNACISCWADARLCDEHHLAFQSGLRWRTILAKREHFRAAFRNFEIDVVARFDEGDVARLLADAGIVRHRGKIEAVIHNARRAQELIAQEGSLAAYVWRYEAHHVAPFQVASTSPASTAMSKDLKQRGWKFVGPTTVYAFMQAMGLVNDHAQDCVMRGQADEARLRFSRPAG